MLRPDQNNEMEDGEPSSGHHRDLSVVDFSNVPSFRRVEAKTGDALRKCSTKSVPFGVLSCTEAVDADADADVTDVKLRSVSTVELRQLHSNSKPKPKTAPRERKRGRFSAHRCDNNRLYIQTDNPFLVVKRKEINNDGDDDNDDDGDGSGGVDQPEAEQLDTDQVLKILTPIKLEQKKTRSVSQSILTQKIKSREDFPRRLVRQRSNTIIGHLPVLERVEDQAEGCRTIYQLFI